MKTIIFLACMLFLLSLPSCNKECEKIPKPICEKGFEIDTKGDCKCPKGKIIVNDFCRKPRKIEFGNANANMPCYKDFYISFFEHFLNPTDTTFETTKNSPNSMGSCYINTDSTGNYAQHKDALYWWEKDSAALRIIFTPANTFTRCDFNGKKTVITYMLLKQPHPDTLRGRVRFADKDLGYTWYYDWPVEFYRQR